MDIFSFDNYKNFVRYLLCEKNQTWGNQNKIAQIMRCQSSYVSQVLKGSPHLSTDNISRLCDHILCSDDEKEYLINLLLIEKSACKNLIRFLKKKNQKLIEKNCPIKEKLKIETKENKLFNSEVYYSKFIFSAIHILLTIEKYQSMDALCKKLSLDPMMIKQCIDELCKMGILESSEHFFKVSNSILYGRSQNDFLRHHSNWSCHLQHLLQMKGYVGLHYIDVVSISEKDYLFIKSEIQKFIESFRKIIAPSKEEEAYNLQIDFFPI